LFAGEAGEIEYNTAFLAARRSFTVTKGAAEVFTEALNNGVEHA
jgi:hypothetical protein